MLVMSAYGQIEQFGSKALSGNKQSSEIYFEAFQKTVFRINPGDTLPDLPVFSVYNPEKPIKIDTSKADKELRKELRNAIDNASKYKADRDTFIKKYVKTYQVLLLNNSTNIQEKLDTVVENISELSVVLDSIKVKDMADLENDENFDKETFAQKLYYLRWKTRKTIDTAKKAQDKLLILQHDLKEIPIDTNVRTINKELDIHKKNLESIKQIILESYKLIEELQTFARTYTIQKNKNKNGQFQLGAQPDILTNFAGSNVLNVVPNIDIIGSYYYDDGANGVSANVRLFSGYANTDSSIHRNASSFWLPEASLFGISFDVLAAFVPAVKDQKNIGTKRIGFRFAPSFLIKNTPERNTNGEFTGTGNGVGVIHVRTGLEYYPIRFLILYANFNCVTPISQVQTFRNFYGTTKSLYPFFDFGFRTPIIISNKENKNTTINIDVNFIGISGDMKAVYPTNDVIIPSIRLGIVQRFNTGD